MLAHQRHAERTAPSSVLFHHLPALALLALLPLTSLADVLFLADGSRISGALKTASAAGYRIVTGFAGELTIPASEVIGISTDEAMTVGMQGDDRVRGRLAFDADSGAQRITDTVFGDITVAGDSIAAVWPRGERSPEVQQEVAALEQRLEKFEDPWSGSIRLGFNIASGNTDNTRLGGRAEARRETEIDRALLYAEGHSVEQNGTLSEKEIRVGAKIEHHLNERWYAYVSEDLENDRFENLRLRSNTAGGLGYFLLREPTHEWKIHAGLGYQFEAFRDGTNNRQGVLPIGSGYRIDIRDWLRFTHDVTIFPAFESPMSDYRLTNNIGLEMPIGDGDLLAIRLGALHEYDNRPVAGAQSLDQTYSADLVIKVP